MSASPKHIAIIGAGLIGLSTADALLRRGYRVSVIDARREVMGGASFANSGMIHPSQAQSWTAKANDPDADQAVRHLALKSRDMLKARMKALGLLLTTEFSEGCYQIFETQAQADQALRTLKSKGVDVQPDDLTFCSIERPALYLREDGWADAYAYGKALKVDLLRSGAAFHMGVEARILLQDDGNVRLHLGGVSFSADEVVVAVGAASRKLLQPLSLTPEIRPVRGWAIDFPRPEKVILPTCPVMDSQTRSALTPFKDRVRLSGTWDEPDTGQLLSRWNSLMPGLNLPNQKQQLVWSEGRPVCALGRPIIDQTPIPRLWLNAGHGHMGWTLCAGSGEYLAEVLQGKRKNSAFAYAQQ